MNRKKLTSKKGKRNKRIRNEKETESKYLSLGALLFDLLSDFSMASAKVHTEQRSPGREHYCGELLYSLILTSVM